VAILNRNGAVELLKEIFEKCTLYDGSYLSLMPPNAAGLLSNGYQIHMKVPFDIETKNCVLDILRKYGLSLSEDKEGLVIIYKPRHKERLDERALS